jgi:hypothetical protein
VHKLRKIKNSVISNQNGAQINHEWTKLIKCIVTLTCKRATTSSLIVHSATKSGVTSKWQKVFGLLRRIKVRCYWENPWGTYWELGETWMGGKNHWENFEIFVSLI